MKKWLTATILLSMLMMTACTSGGTGTGGASDGEVTISFFRPGLNQPNAKKPIQELVDRFEKKYPKIHVELKTAGWNQTYQKLVTGFKGGTSPDVIYGGTRWVGAFSKMGGIMSLDEYAKEHLQLYSETLQEGAKIDGKIYAIPRAFSSKALIYRSDLIKEPPKTWNEVIEVAKKIQKEHPDMYGFAIAGAKHVSTTGQFFTLLFSNGGEVFDENGNVVLNSPEGVKTLQFYADLYLKHKIVPNPIAYNREELPNLFKQGKIAMFYCGPWAQSSMGLKPDNSKAPYKSALLPKAKTRTSILVSDSLMVSANTEYPDAAWKFIEFATSPKNQFIKDKDTGTVPIQVKEAKKPFFKKDPYFSTFVEMANHGKSQPVPAAWEPFQDIITTAIQKALNGGDPKAILDKAVQQIKEQHLEPK